MIKKKKLGFGETEIEFLNIKFTIYKNFFTLTFHNKKGNTTKNEIFSIEVEFEKDESYKGQRILLFSLWWGKENKRR